MFPYHCVTTEVLFYLGELAILYMYLGASSLTELSVSSSCFQLIPGVFQSHIFGNNHNLVSSFTMFIPLFLFVLVDILEKLSNYHGESAHPDDPHFYHVTRFPLLRIMAAFGLRCIFVLLMKYPYC